MTKAELWIYRRGFVRGFRQGLLHELPTYLEVKFGPEGMRLLTRLKRISNFWRFQAVFERLGNVDTLDDFLAVLSKRPTRAALAHIERTFWIEYDLDRASHTPRAKPVSLTTCCSRQLRRLQL